jgi:hypothetical protein
VSLKEGMFNNATVLFRARFRDGASQVAPPRASSHPHTASRLFNVENERARCSTHSTTQRESYGNTHCVPRPPLSAVARVNEGVPRQVERIAQAPRPKAITAGPGKTAA